MNNKGVPFGHDLKPVPGGQHLHYSLFIIHFSLFIITGYMIDFLSNICYNVIVL